MRTISLTKNGDRLWVNVRVIDSTGTVELRMWQKAALSLSGMTEATEFVELAAKGALNFPILCSIRVTMRKSTWTGDAGGEYVDTVFVEAASQDLFFSTIGAERFPESIGGCAAHGDSGPPLA